jgi:prepilin-type N-terminal cleavage/methylation domain-containing protein
MRGLRGTRGFTLAEVLVATAILTIGLVAVATGFQYATSGVATGRGQTTAVFLAEQRIEQLKAQALTNFTGIAAGATTEYCLSGNIGAGSTNCQAGPVSGPSYTRVTTVTDLGVSAACPGPSVSCKQVQVRVTYRPVTSSGDLSQQRTLDVFTILAPRT